MLAKTMSSAMKRQKNPLMVPLTRRCFSVFGTDKRRQIIEDGPWRLGNTNAKLLETRPDSHKSINDLYQKECLEKNTNGLKDGLEMTYRAFH